MVTTASTPAPPGPHRTSYTAPVAIPDPWGVFDVEGLPVRLADEGPGEAGGAVRIPWYATDDPLTAAHIACVHSLQLAGVAVKIRRALLRAAPLPRGVQPTVRDPGPEHLADWDRDLAGSIGPFAGLAGCYLEAVAPLLNRTRAPGQVARWRVLYRPNAHALAVAIAEAVDGKRDWAPGGLVNRVGAMIAEMRQEYDQACALRPPAPGDAREQGGDAADAAAAPGAPGQYVTLDQAAALVGRNKRTLERYLGFPAAGMPGPDVQGGRGRPHEWLWPRLRPWLERTFGRPLPAVFPAGR